MIHDLIKLTFTVIKNINLVFWNVCWLRVHLGAPTWSQSRTLVFLFTTASLASVQISLQWKGQLRSSYSSENGSWFPSNGFRDPHRSLDHALRTTDLDLHPFIWIGERGERKVQTGRLSVQAISCAFSHWFSKRVIGKEEDMLIFTEENGQLGSVCPSVVISLVTRRITSASP